jgi:AraC family transcriptional regulator
VREQLHDDSATALRLHVIAQRAGVHPVHLTRAFRQCFGCSPGDYVRQRRIDRACVALTESDRSITTIALDAGFSSPSHFATAFRRATGMTPRDYRSTAQSATSRAKGMFRS